MAVAYIVFPSSVLSAVRYHKDINFPFMNIGNNFTHTQVQFEFGSGPMIFFTELCPLNFEIIFCAIKCKTKYDIWNFGCLWGGGAFLSIYVLLYDNLQQNKLYNALDDKWHQIRLITMNLATSLRVNLGLFNHNDRHEHGNIWREDKSLRTSTLP